MLGGLDICRTIQAAWSISLPGLSCYLSWFGVCTCHLFSQSFFSSHSFHWCWCSSVVKRSYTYPSMRCCSLSTEGIWWFVCDSLSNVLVRGSSWWCWLHKASGLYLQGIWCLASSFANFSSGLRLDDSTLRIAVGLRLCTKICVAHQCWNCSGEVECHACKHLRRVMNALPFLPVVWA